MRRTLMPLLALCACTPTDLGPSPLLDVPATEWHSLPALSGQVQVVRVEGDVPHIYAATRADLVRASGFVQARDRYFEMEMARRLGLGELSALLGDAALETDQETRGSGMTWIVDHMLAEMPEEHRRLLGWFAEGINAYIAAVKAGDLPPPSEFELAAGLLGRETPEDLLVDWDERAVGGVVGSIVYNLGYETGDIGRQRTEDQLAELVDRGPFPTERRAGAIDDVWRRVEPVHAVTSAAGWGLDTVGSRSTPPAPRALTPSGVPADLLDRAASRQDRLQRRLGHDWVHGFGSNAWAVGATASADGRAYLAGDGHLPLSVPSLFYSIGLHGLDPEDGTDQVGMVIPGMPVLAVGTNGHVAWSQTQLMGDITDWYREEIRLDASGEPADSWFQGEWRPLQRVDESYVIADVPLLDSEGRTETWARWVTFDGRWLADVEGRSASPTETLDAGEALVTMQGDLVVPEDLDGDGVVSGLSFDYTGFDLVDLLGPVDGFGHARDVWELREATRGLLAYSQNIAAADRDGSVLYTGYQAVPCRTHLPRDEDGAFLAGADPNRLIDGTIYGGFTIPTLPDGTVDESYREDPARCVVPFEEYPQAIDPAAGFVLTANNDPGRISLDGNLYDDPWYIGGPWIEGYRAQRIFDVLEAEVAAGTADLDAMMRLQGDHHSMLAAQFLPALLEAIDVAQAAAGGRATAPTSEQRMVALYESDAAAIDEVETRLGAWQDAGLMARSGVETFYDPILAGDVEAAAATSIFNAWIGRFVRYTLDDEALPDVWEPTGDTGHLRAMTYLLAGRGPDNPLGLASWVSATEESVLFDDPNTVGMETSHELAIKALVDALAFLRSAPVEDGRGGYGTDDMDAWQWGLRHWVHFDSVLAEFLGNDPTYAFLTERFAITPDVLPMGGDLDDLPGFPRHGDHLNVDAGNSGLNGERFSYGSGPVFRMVIALGPDGVEGRNILPGGQSGLNDSEFFADQATLWLGNETLPMRLSIEDVAAGATHREVLSP